MRPARLDLQPVRPSLAAMGDKLIFGWIGGKPIPVAAHIG